MFTFKGTANNFGTSATATVTHGLTIAAGDLVVLYINRNDDVNLSMVAGGEDWTELFNVTPTDETSKHAVFYKIAGASEPASFSVDLTSSSLFNVCLSVWETENSNVEIDNQVSFFNQSNDSLVGYAVGGNTMAANALSITGAGKDRSATTGAHTTATEGYTGAIGHTDGRDTAMAHRIFTAQTLQNDSPVFGPNATTFDQIYSWHFSLLDVAPNNAVASSGEFDETGDALAASVEPLTASSGAFVEQGDSLAALVLFPAEAAYSVAEQGDTLSASADVGRQASFNLAEVGDALAVSSFVVPRTQAAFAEQGDSLAADVEAGIGASFNLVEVGDALTSSASAFLPASFNLVEQGDSLVSSSFAVPSIEFAIAEQGDVLAAIAGEFTSAIAEFVEQGDDLDASLVALVSGTAAFVEQGDTLLASSVSSNVAAAAFAEQGDALAVSALSLQLSTYTLVEQGDELDAAAANLQFITYALVEQGDELDARGATLVTSSFTHIERGDTLAAEGSLNSLRKAYNLVGKTNKIKLSEVTRYELSN